MDNDDLEDTFALVKLMEAVENQVLEGQPREAGLVLTALTALGQSHEEALADMAEILAAHIARTFAADSGFEINAYAADLLKLQALREESED